VVLPLDQPFHGCVLADAFRMLPVERLELLLCVLDACVIGGDASHDGLRAKLAAAHWALVASHEVLATELGTTGGATDVYGFAAVSMVRCDILLALSAQRVDTLDERIVLLRGGLRDGIGIAEENGMIAIEALVEPADCLLGILAGVVDAILMPSELARRIAAALLVVSLRDILVEFAKECLAVCILLDDRLVDAVPHDAFPSVWEALVLPRFLLLMALRYHDAALLFGRNMMTTIRTQILTR